jgi:hypothetical protein
MNEIKHLIHFLGSLQGTSPGFAALLDRRGLCHRMLCRASPVVASKQLINSSRLAGGTIDGTH